MKDVMCCSSVTLNWKSDVSGGPEGPYHNFGGIELWQYQLV